MHRAKRKKSPAELISEAAGTTATRCHTWTAKEDSPKAMPLRREQCTNTTIA
jgi:hypothetical protein